MGNENENSIKVWFFLLPSLCYCYFIVSKLPKGKLRLFSLLPIFYLFTILPLHLSTVFPTGLTALFLTWLANFTLLLFAFDQGPLSFHPPKSLPHFIFITCLPIKISQSKTYPSRKTQTSPQTSSSFDQKQPLSTLIWPTKVLLYAILLGLSYNNNDVHAKIMVIIYCCMVYLLIDIIFGACHAIVHLISGFELDPPSDQPYFSTSLQDFWGRRWNLMVANTLRHAVYQPTRSALDTVFSSRWAPLPAVMAAFVVSGLMHELIFYYVTRARPRGRSRVSLSCMGLVWLRSLF